MSKAIKGLNKQNGSRYSISIGLEYNHHFLNEEHQKLLVFSSPRKKKSWGVVFLL